MSNIEATQLKTEPTELMQRFNNVIEEQELSNLISNYVFSHDKCFGSEAGPKDDLAWESLFDVSGTSELHPIGLHKGREGKMAWAQQALGGRGRGCQIRLFNPRIYLDSSDSDSATASSNATIDVLLDDESKAISVKGQYHWVFRKVESVWKIAHVKLSPIPEQQA
ncbi:unnamed protein product [Rhizoctonia solani]|uniref:SnoaL-like domain-containing protein n=1 Tax=Rhizoctonia solani TaxID=456999 RepID=A0A8H3A7X2_9AGAM|nr:unnamed protein product [Rhizoctonia solani]